MGVVLAHLAVFGDLLELYIGEGWAVEETGVRTWLVDNGNL